MLSELKYLFLPFAIASFVIPSVSFASNSIGEVLGASKSCIILSKDLKIKSKVKDVLKLQTFLVKQGLLDEVVSGYFGPATKKAVIAFQEQNNISPASGYVGKATRAKIKEIDCGYFKTPVMTDETSNQTPEPQATTTPEDKSTQKYYPFTSNTQTILPVVTEFMSFPLLSIDYDPSGKEVGLTGSVTMKITAGSSPLEFYKYKSVRFNGPGDSVFNGSSTVTIDDVPNMYESTKLYPGGSTVYKIKISTPTDSIPGGVYTMTAGEIYDIYGKKVFAVNGTLKSNAVTIIGKTGSQVLGAYSQCLDIMENLHRGANSESVTELQKFLSGKGLLSEDATGFYGDKTVEAVKKYQESMGIKDSGMVYEYTREAIKGETCR